MNNRDRMWKRLPYGISKLKLLLRAEVPIKEVCYASGFSDTNYFCRLFRKMVGVTPGQFRQGAV